MFNLQNIDFTVSFTFNNINHRLLWIKPISKDRIKTLLNKEPMYCLSIESSNILYIQVGINNEFKLAFCFCAFEKVEREINFNEVGKAQHVKWFYFKNYSDVIAVFILRYVETKNENVFWLDTSCIYLFLSIKVCPYSRGIPTHFPNYIDKFFIYS